MQEIYGAASAVPDGIEDEMKRFITVLAAMSLLSFAALGAGSAHGAAVPKATGSIQMSGPVQYLSFDAFTSTPVKGNVSYTNFAPAYATAGTGVWVPTAFDLGIAVAPSTTIGGGYAMTVSSFTPTSPTSVTFSGTGTTTGWNATFTGTTSGSAFTLAMTEINAANPSETYALTATGTIALDGSVIGDWSDNYGTGRLGTFAIADLGYSAYHYAAHVAHVSVTGSDAYFDYVIPGTTVVVYTHVSDGGQPGAGHDTWGYTTTQGAGFIDSTIVSGNLTVFS